MSWPRRRRWWWWTALVLAIACPLAWLTTALHLALEDHQARPHAADHDHEQDQGPGHASRPDALDDADDHEHHAGDHLLPAWTRPSVDAPLVPFVPTALGLVAPTLAGSLADSPSEDVAPATDPPLESLRPRAPPLG